MRMGEALRARGAGRRATRVVDTDYFPLDGGLNTEDSPLTARPGDLIGVKNYEAGAQGGYRRVDGIEPFDGQASPGTAAFVFLEFDAGVVANYPEVGDTINGQTSGATGVLIGIGRRTAYGPGYTGGFGAPETLGYVAMVSVSGTFQNNENLREGSTVFAVADGAPLSFAPTDALNDEFTQAAEDLLRADIAAVPGSGPVRGVWFFEGVVYAWRNNVGGTACVMHKSTGSGWTAITLNKKLRFDAGSIAFAEGDTVTGATSGATGVVRRVGTNGGIYGSGTKTGYLIFQSITGTFQDNENLQVSSVTRAVANGADFVQTFPPGGRYEFRSNNFYGHANKYRFYGVNGVGKAFEYDPDDSTCCQIDTGMTTDTPIHIGVHLDYLVLGFVGGSTQLSGQNTPLSFEVALGAGELALGEEITGYLEEVGSDDSLSLFVMGRNRIYRLSGTTAANFALRPFKPNVGAREWSIQRLSNGMFLDDQGFTTLTASDTYGGFLESIISKKAAKRVSGLLADSSVIDSHISRDLSVYRCSFANGENVAIGVREVPTQGGRMTKNYRLTVTNYGVPIRCSCEEEDTDGRLRTFLGSDDGWVYEQRPEYTSFAGEEIEAFIRTHYHFSKAPQRHKRYRRAYIDIKTDTRQVVAKVVADFMSGDPRYNFQPVADLTVSGGGGFWDISEWSEFQWSALVNPVASVALRGSGTNLSIGFYGKQRGELSHTLHGITVHHSMRRQNRATSV